MNNVDLGNSGYPRANNQPVKEKGSIRAAAASQLVSIAASAPLSIAAVKVMKLPSSKLNSSQIQQLKDAADEFISSTGLKNKGVQIFQPKNINDITGTFKKIAKGENACFLQKDLKDIYGNIIHKKNSILINMEKIPTAAFHEIGHAFNNNKSKFWNIMQKMRMPGMVLASAIALFAAFTKEAKPEDGQELTKAQKVKNAVRKNSGKLAFASMIPMLLEEGMASIRGCKFANKVLSKDLAKKVLHTNLLGYCSYIGAAVAAGITAFAATKIKDNIMHKQELKQNAESAN